MQVLTMWGPAATKQASQSNKNCFLSENVIRKQSKQNNL